MPVLNSYPDSFQFIMPYSKKKSSNMRSQNYQDYLWVFNTYMDQKILSALYEGILIYFLYSITGVLFARSSLPPIALKVILCLIFQFVVVKNVVMVAFAYLRMFVSVAKVSSAAVVERVSGAKLLLNCFAYCNSHCNVLHRAIVSKWPELVLLKYH